MRVLFAEDDSPKARNVSNFLSGLLLALDIDHRQSVRSALGALKSPAYDLLLLDISLPTFDISGSERGGRPQSAGAMEILDYMSYAEIDVPTLLITQHEAFDFEGVTLPLIEMKARMESRYSNYRGLVQYNAISGQWKDDLRQLLTTLGMLRND